MARIEKTDSIALGLDDERIPSRAQRVAAGAQLEAGDSDREHGGQHQTEHDRGAREGERDLRETAHDPAAVALLLPGDNDSAGVSRLRARGCFFIVRAPWPPSRPPSADT